MEKNIHFRAVIEVLGKPKEHVEKSLQDFVAKLKKSDDYQVIKEDFAAINKQEEQDLWATFAEVEVKTDKIENLTMFCFDYMPSMLEIIEPSEMKLSSVDFTQFLNDLQAKLHQVDMIAKQVKVENDILKKSMGALLKNYVTVLLKGRNLTGQELSNLTGVPIDRLGDFLDQLIDEGRIDLKGEEYFLKDNE